MKEEIFPDPKTIKVFPAFVEIDVNRFANQFASGFVLTGNRIQREKTFAASVRKYMPGDKVSWIHWKQSARKNTLMTKEFEESQETNDWLLMFDPSPHPDFEVQVVFTASIMRALLKRGVSVGLVSFNRKMNYFPCQKGNEQLRTLNDYLATVQVDASEGNFPIFNPLPEFSRNQQQSLMIIVNQLEQRVVDQFLDGHKKFGQCLIVIVKGKETLVSKEERDLIHTLNKRGIITKVVYEGAFENAF